jgi:hypothetical protein
MAGGGLWGKQPGALHTLQGIHECVYGIRGRRPQVPLQHLRPPQPHVCNCALGMCMLYALLLMLTHDVNVCHSIVQGWTTFSIFLLAGQTATSANWALMAGVSTCMSGQSCVAAPSSLSPHQNTWCGICESPLL